MKKLFDTIFIIFICSLFGTASWAGINNVPADYSTIQAAIDAANSGDTVVVAPGTYNEDISLKSGVTVQGAGSANTTIQGTGSGSVVTAINVSDTTITGFTISGGTGNDILGKTYGGGINCGENCFLTISNNIITGNTAGNGGGISRWEGSSLTISHNTITENSAGFGGGVWSGHVALDDRLDIDNNIISENNGDTGGGIYISVGESYPEVSTLSTVLKSLAENSIPPTTITNNTITRNTVIDTGGGIFSLFAIHGLNISHNTISENTAGDHGGGLYGTSSPATISYNTITGNTAGFTGGGMDWAEGDTFITHNTISENTSEYGGGIYTVFSSSPIIINNMITKNHAGTGGGIFCDFASLAEIINNTITGNTADEGGGIYRYEQSSVVITNSIVWGNDVDDLVENPYTTPTYSCVGNPILGGTNISDDPLFIDAAGGNYNLQPASPCVNTGNNDAVPSWLTTDFEGDGRIVNLVVDIGADEVALQTTIDMNSNINTKSKGVIPVDILGSSYFDIESVNVTSDPPKFGPDGATPKHDLSNPLVYADHRQDVNGDGYLDLRMHFNIQDTGIKQGDTEACLNFTVGAGEEHTLCHGILAR